MGFSFSLSLFKSFLLSRDFFFFFFSPSWFFFFFFLNFVYLFYLFMAVLGLCCSAGFSLVVASGGYSLVAVHGLLIAVVSLVAEHGL